MKSQQQPIAAKINLRQASSNDDENIAKLSVMAWQESYDHILSVEELASLEWQTRANGRREFFHDAKRGSLVIEVNNDIVAFADYGPARLQPNTDIDNSYSEIYAIYVLNNFKRKGLGKMLYNAIEKILIKNGYKNIIIWTLTKNLEAICFYEAIGFIIQPWHKQFNFNSNAYDETAFTKILRATI